MSTTLGEALVGVVAVTTLPAGILVALFLGPFEAAVVFVVGWLFLVPVLGILSEGVRTTDSTGDEIEAAVKERIAESITEDGDGSAGGERDGEDPLEALRERYARGEIGDVEFERKLERLVETEDVEVPEGASFGDVSDETDRDEDVAFER